MWKESCQALQSVTTTADNNNNSLILVQTNRTKYYKRVGVGEDIIFINSVSISNGKVGFLPCLVATGVDNKGRTIQAF